MQQHGAKGVIVVDREKQQSLKFMNSRDHNTTKNVYFLYVCNSVDCHSLGVYQQILFLIHSFPSTK